MQVKVTNLSRLKIQKNLNTQNSSLTENDNFILNCLRFVNRWHEGKLKVVIINPKVLNSG